MKCLLKFLKCRKQKRFRWQIGLAKLKEKNMLELKITNEQKVKVTIVPVTATGKPALLDGPPSWSVASGDATLAVSADGLSSDLISSDTPGESMIVVSADADLGAGVENISDSIKLTIEGAKAAVLGLVAGTPEAK